MGRISSHQQLLGIKSPLIGNLQYQALLRPPVAWSWVAWVALVAGGHSGDTGVLVNGGGLGSGRHDGISMSSSHSLPSIAPEENMFHGGLVGVKMILATRDKEPASFWTSRSSTVDPHPLSAQDWPWMMASSQRLAFVPVTRSTLFSLSLSNDDDSFWR
jgi:hypothetical protein